MFKKRTDAQYRFLLGLLLITAILASVFVTTADARRARDAARGAAIGAGIGAIVDGGRGVGRGAAVGAILGATR